MEWEFLSSEGVVERRPQPEWQVLDLEESDLPKTVFVRSEVLGSGPGRKAEAVQIVSEGAGGRPYTGDFSRWVGDMVEGPNGDIWAAVRSGLVRFDGEIWTLYTSEDGLMPFFIADLEFDSKGHLWMAGDKGVGQFDGNRWIWHQIMLGGDFEPSLTIDRTESITVDHNGNIWTGSTRIFRLGPDLQDDYEPLLYRFDGTNWWEYSSKDGLPVEGSVAVVDADQSGRVWARVGGLVSFDGTQFIGYRPPKGFVELFW